MEILFPKVPNYFHSGQYDGPLRIRLAIYVRAEFNASTSSLQRSLTYEV